MLIVTSEFPPLPGGIGNHACQLAKALAKKGHSITVIADQRGDLEEEQRFDRGLPFEVKRIALRSFRFWMYIQRIKKTLSAMKTIDIVIASGKFSLWNVGLCTLLYSKPSVAVIHGTEVNFKSALLNTSIKQALKRFDRVVAVSSYTKGLVQHIRQDVTVIPNGIAMSEWAAIVSDRLILKGFPKLTTVGRISERKGQYGVINQLPELLRVFPELHYHCIGMDEDAEACKALAEELKVKDHVTFHGVLSQKELKQALQETDIFVMLSMESRSGDVEGFGIAVLEANALGIPAIGAKGTGIEDAIQQGETGYLIDRKDTEAFKACIAQILQDKTAFVTRAKAWAETHDWSALVTQYETVLACQA